MIALVMDTFALAWVSVHSVSCGGGGGGGGDDVCVCGGGGGDVVVCVCM